MKRIYGVKISVFEFPYIMRIIQNARPSNFSGYESLGTGQKGQVLGLSRDECAEYNSVLNWAF